ncbi:hypothetical protein AQUCO_04100112v1 [Aquilegia coerulea]|uniref:RING-type E3 ubiquitin transferase n=1 Tax=Aquilegia coerulea TaxID=218851 RepID=A0A2G5CQA0_AQUCA|nr:hypothetical protein AQUCO_04100112v1 [Aquilegia coerulea]
MDRGTMVSSLLSQFALAIGGGVSGFTLGYTTLRTWIELKSTSFALYKITQAKTVPIYDLRSLIASSLDDSESSNKTLVVIRGVVEAKARNWGSFTPNVLVSPSSGEKGVILQETQVLLVSSQQQYYDPVIVDLDSSTHLLPLTTVYHKLQDLHVMSDEILPYAFLEAFFLPVGHMQKKILPLGKEINAIGLCSLQDGNLHIKATQELPYFLSEMTKGEMVKHLAYKTTILFWGGCIIGIVSLGVLGYTSFRIWEWWKVRRQHFSNAEVDDVYIGNDEIPSEQLCTICTMRRKKYACVPCGHLVCCHKCARSIQHDSTARCPECRHIMWFRLDVS